MTVHYNLYNVFSFDRTLSSEEIVNRLNNLEQQDNFSNPGGREEIAIARTILGSKDRRDIYDSRLDNLSGPDINVSTLRDLAGMSDSSAFLEAADIRSRSVQTPAAGSSAYSQTQSLQQDEHSEEHTTVLPSVPDDTQHVERVSTTDSNNAPSSATPISYEQPSFEESKHSSPYNNVQPFNTQPQPGYQQPQQFGQPQQNFTQTQAGYQQPQQFGQPQQQGFPQFQGYTGQPQPQPQGFYQPQQFAQLQGYQQGYQTGYPQPAAPKKSFNERMGDVKASMQRPSVVAKLPNALTWSFLGTAIAGLLLHLFPWVNLSVTALGFIDGNGYMSGLGRATFSGFGENETQWTIYAMWPALILIALVAAFVLMRQSKTKLATWIALVATSLSTLFGWIGIFSAGRSSFFLGSFESVDAELKKANEELSDFGDNLINYSISTTPAQIIWTIISTLLLLVIIWYVVVAKPLASTPQGQFAQPQGFGQPNFNQQGYGQTGFGQPQGFAPQGYGQPSFNQPQGQPHAEQPFQSTQNVEQPQGQHAQETAEPPQNETPSKPDSEQ